MKKRMFGILLLCVLAFTLTACDEASESSNSNSNNTVNKNQNNKNKNNNNGNSNNSNGKENNKNKVEVNFEGTDIGNEVCFAEECFYIISHDGNNIKLLAKYNLYVGGSYTSGLKPYGDEATGLQSSEMDGISLANSGKERNGIVLFSNGTLEYEESNLYEHVQNYKSKLEDMGVSIEKAELITIEELESLGCDISKKDCKTSPFEWIYSSSYWTKSIYSNSKIWAVRGDSGNLILNYPKGTDFGVRPVITVKESVIRK